MKRPLAVAGFSLLIFLVFLCLFGNISSAIILAATSYLMFIISAAVPEIRKGYIVPTALFCAFLSCCAFYFMQSDYNRLARLADKDADVVCEILEEPIFNSTYSRYYCKAKVKTIDSKSYHGNIRLSFSGVYDDIEAEDLSIGDTLSFSGHLYKVGGEDKDIIDYFKSENIYIGVYSLKNIQIAPPDIRPLSFYGNEIRKYISLKFRENFKGDTAGFLTALLTGDKSYVSDDVYDSFKNSGVAHLMAVSGMHLAVLVLFLNLFIKKLRRNHKNLYFTILSVFILFFMFMASFSSSVVRAGVMLLVLLTGQLIDKRADSLNSLGFACICILLVNPYSAMNVGFLLSVLSTLAIILSAVPFCNRHRYFICDKLGFSGRVPFFIGQAIMLSLAISLSVMVYTLPIMALFFGRVSLISPVANLLFLPVTTIIIILSFISAILCSLGVMPDLLIYIAEKISDYCLGVADILGSTDRFVLKTESALSIGVCIAMPFVMYLAINAGKKLYRKIRRKIKPL